MDTVDMKSENTVLQHVKGVIGGVNAVHTYTNGIKFSIF